MERKDGTVVSAGPVDFLLRYRAEIMDDQGLSLQVYAKVDDKDTEILRFDCFDQAPHYHYGPENFNIRLYLDKTTAGNPVSWTLDNIRNNLPAMVRRAGYEELADDLESNPVPEATLDELETTSRRIALEDRRTVLHTMREMEDGDMFEAGNVRFGLEFRHIPSVSNGGVAIHVLADIADQEVEILAFDCFKDAPHYHYGPRNQDVRIYWDVTTSGDTLRWTLDQFKTGKLRTMIERAGYPTVAADLDERLIQEQLVKIEERCMVLEAEQMPKVGVAA